MIHLININNHTNESFMIVSKEKTLSEIIDLFSSSYNTAKQLGAIFVTKKGNQSEEIISMITPWDLINIK